MNVFSFVSRWNCVELLIVVDLVATYRNEVTRLRRTVREAVSRYTDSDGN